MVLNMSILRHLKYGRSNLGFTFAELIIAIFVALVLSGLAVLIFVGSTREIGQIKRASDRDFELARVYWQIKRQIFSAYDNPNSDFKKNIEFVSSEDKKSDFLRFFCASPEVGTGVCEACYYIGKNKDKNALFYFENPFPREFNEENRLLAEKNGHILSEFITGINFTFLKNGKEIEGNISSFPDYIYVKLYYIEENKEQVFEFAVHHGVRR